VEQYVLCGSPVFFHYTEARLNGLPGSSLGGTSVSRMTDGRTGKPRQYHLYSLRPRQSGMSLL